MKTKVFPDLCSLVMMLVLISSGCNAAPKDIVAAPPPTTVANPSASAPISAEPPPADWQTYDNAVRGFRISYPPDWTYKSMEMGGPGMPEDWPIESIVAFFPQSLAEVMNRQGPPDPNAPEAVPPFNIEVCVGPMEQFRRVYPEPGMIEEGLEINGASMIVERDTYDDFNTARYVFAHPATPDVRVVLVDVISGFSERAKANPEYLDVIARVVASFAFTPEASSIVEPDPLAYRSVLISEVGLTFEVPEGWDQRTPEWIWEPFGSQGQRIGVQWLDLQPPQEAEAALLPSQAQIVASEEVELAWAKGRSFTLDVCAPNTQDEDAKATVASVERHIIVVISQAGGRRAYDFYATGDTAEHLDIVMPVYHHLLDSITLDGVQTDPLDMIRVYVATELNTDPNTLDLTLQETEFPDSCLGIPNDGEICAQVLTPGYVGQAKAGDVVYEVRAGQDGQQILLIP